MFNLNMLAVSERLRGWLIFFTNDSRAFVQYEWDLAIHPRE